MQEKRRTVTTLLPFFGFFTPFSSSSRSPAIAQTDVHKHLTQCNAATRIMQQSSDCHKLESVHDPGSGCFPHTDHSTGSVRTP